MNNKTRHSLLSLALALMGTTAPALAAPSDETTADVPPPVAAALESALVVPGGRMTVRSFKPTAAAGATCNVREASLERPIEGSGRFPVKVSGRGCTGWAWAEVKVYAAVLVTTRPVRAGDSLEGAVAEEERELRPPLREVATDVKGSRASRALGRGQIVDRSHLEAAGAAPGSTIKIVVRTGALQVVQTGRVVPCGRGRTCAVVPSGKHVEGEIVDGRLIVEAL